MTSNSKGSRRAETEKAKRRELDNAGWSGLLGFFPDDLSGFALTFGTIFEVYSLPGILVQLTSRYVWRWPSKF
jgi:hypothetical protein